jgi:hypothetical protein
LRSCTKNTLQQKLLPSLKMPTLAPIRLSNTSFGYNQLDLIIVIKCEKNNMPKHTHTHKISKTIKTYQHSVYHMRVKYRQRVAIVMHTHTNISTKYT